MSIVAAVLVTVVALLHAWFLVLEMFLWRRPLGLRTFGMTPQQAEVTAVLAANQGLYNGFLAAGLAVGLIAAEPTAYYFRLFFLVCVIVAGLYGAATVSKTDPWSRHFPRRWHLLRSSLPVSRPMTVVATRVAAVVLVVTLAGACGSTATTPAPAPATAVAPTISTQSAFPPSAAPSPTQSLPGSTSIPTIPAGIPSPLTSASPTMGPTQVPTSSVTPIPTLSASPTISASTNLIEVFAGGGTADPSAGGQATDAHIQRPTGLAIAGNGTVGIVDSSAGNSAGRPAQWRDCNGGYRHDRSTGNVPRI